MGRMEPTKKDFREEVKTASSLETKLKQYHQTHGKGTDQELFKTRFMVYQHAGTLDLESTKKVETTVIMTSPTRVTI